MQRSATEKPKGAYWKSLLGNLFGIDGRSLALFRMAMAVLLLVDLAIRATDLNAMYTDAGMFPRGLIHDHYTNWNWSFHFGSGTWTGQAMLFLIAAGLALALFVGFETRIAVVGSWLMLISIHHRVPPILSGADILFRVLLFWAMFLPLERMWSLDRWMEKRHGMHDDEPRVVSVASAAILLQIALMYLFSAMFKSNPVWFRGETIAGILAHDFYASSLGEHLLHFPWLLTGVTWTMLALEWAALLLFFPICTARLRIWMIAALTAMHVGIGICLNVDLFSPVAITGLILFLPTAFWNRHFSHATEGGQIAAPQNLGGDERPGLFYLQQGLCLLLLLYVIAINLNTLPSHPLGRVAPEKWKVLATSCGLGQRWDVFESIPSNDGWYVAKAKLEDGSEIDLLTGGAAIDWQRPKNPAGIHPNHRSRKLFREMAHSDERGFQAFREPVAMYLCRDWNQRNASGKQVAEFEFIYCMESQQKPGMSSPEILRQPLVQLDLKGR